MEHEEAVVGVTVRDDEKGVDDEESVPVVREEQKIHFSSQVTQVVYIVTPLFFNSKRASYL